MNLGNQPVEILIEDVYLLVVPSPQTNVDPDEEERRAQAAKAERLENAELLHMRGQAEINSGTVGSCSCGRILAKESCFRYLGTDSRAVGVTDRKDHQQSSGHCQKYTCPL
jgi:hypothetical protein